MAMNVWMTISVFVVVVMATTVIALECPPPSHGQNSDRSSRKCCAVKSYQCLRDRGCFNPVNSKCAEPCKTTDTTSCGSTTGDNCCSIYKSCLVECQIAHGDQREDQLLCCYNICDQSYPC
nr:TPA_inf: conotoxin precursor Con-ikot-ikot [Conus judaeus]